MKVPDCVLSRESLLNLHHRRVAQSVVEDAQAHAGVSRCESPDIPSAQFAMRRPITFARQPRDRFHHACGQG
jgi:hypothetical protein